MKKFIYIVMFMLGLSILTSSCTKADGGNSSSIEGSWKIIKVAENGSSIVVVPGAFWIGDVYTFDSKGTVTMKNPYSTDTASYSYNKTTGVINIATESFEVKSITSNNMQWKWGKYEIFFSR